MMSARTSSQGTAHRAEPAPTGNPLLSRVAPREVVPGRHPSPPIGHNGIDTGGRSPHRLRTAVFALGDGAFLVLIGGVSGLIAETVWGWGLPGFLGMLIGMGLAMVVQTILSLLIAPLLGSIESMAPSMIVAMAVPMILDVLRMAGGAPDRGRILGCGAVAGAAMFVFLAVYGTTYRRSLRRAYGHP